MLLRVKSAKRRARVLCFVTLARHVSVMSPLFSGMVVEGIEIGLGLGGIRSRLAEESEDDAREAAGGLAAQVAGVGHAYLGEGLAVLGVLLCQLEVETHHVNAAFLEVAAIGLLIGCTERAMTSECLTLGK